MHKFSKGQRIRVWLGQDFTRDGIILQINEYEQEVYIKWNYDLPNEWIAMDRVS